LRENEFENPKSSNEVIVISEIKILQMPISSLGSIRKAIGNTIIPDNIRILVAA
jgi:hypothetical protein